MFTTNLHDLIKGIRKHSTNERAYVSNCLKEIKSELKNVKPNVKAVAVQKLMYLHMIGYDASWASFHIVEVMSQQTFRHKRIGYLAAEQVFKKNDPRTKDFVLLSTNLLKKQLHSKNPYASGLAVNCVSNIVTKDLARDLLGDVTAMLESSNAYLRKKGVLVMYVHFFTRSYIHSLTQTLAGTNSIFNTLTDFDSRSKNYVNVLRIRHRVWCVVR